MLALYITVPLMIIAVAIAVTPVLRGSIRHHQAMQEGELETGATAEHEADFWHRVLGHRRTHAGSPSPTIATPAMVDDSEVMRVGVPAEELQERADGPTVWKSPS